MVTMSVVWMDLDLAERMDLDLVRLMDIGKDEKLGFLKVQQIFLSLFLSHDCVEYWSFEH